VLTAVARVAFKSVSHLRRTGTLVTLTHSSLRSSQPTNSTPDSRSQEKHQLYIMETFSQVCEWGGVLRLAIAAGFSSAGTFGSQLPLDSAMAAHVPLENCTSNLDVLEGAFQSDVDGSTPPAKLARRALSSQAICDVAFAGEASWVASNWPVGNVSTALGSASTDVQFLSNVSKHEHEVMWTNVDVDVRTPPVLLHLRQSAQVHILMGRSLVSENFGDVCTQTLAEAATDLATAQSTLDPSLFIPSCMEWSNKDVDAAPLKEDSHALLSHRLLLQERCVLEVNWETAAGGAASNCCDPVDFNRVEPLPYLNSDVDGRHLKHLAGHASVQIHPFLSRQDGTEFGCAVVCNWTARPDYDRVSRLNATLEIVPEKARKQCLHTMADADAKDPLVLEHGQAAHFESFMGAPWVATFAITPSSQAAVFDAHAGYSDASRCADTFFPLAPADGAALSTSEVDMVSPAYNLNNATLEGGGVDSRAVMGSRSFVVNNWNLLSYRSPMASESDVWMLQDTALGEMAKDKDASPNWCAIGRHGVCIGSDGNYHDWFHRTHCKSHNLLMFVVVCRAK